MTENKKTLLFSILGVILLLVVVIGVVIQGIVGYLTNQIPQISIISVVITPYLIFFTQRAYGLLYSDIA